MSSNEIIQLVDESNQPIATASRRAMREQRLTHRASYILVFNHTGELFIHQRTYTKDIYPGYWDVAAGGVVLADESYEESARRELKEELGVRGRLRHLFDKYYEDENNRVWGRVFATCHNGPFILQKEEIVQGRFISIKEMLAMSKTEQFTPDGLMIIKDLPENIS